MANKAASDFNFSPSRIHASSSPRYPRSPARFTPLHKFAAPVMQENVEDAEIKAASSSNFSPSRTHTYSSPRYPNSPAPSTPLHKFTASMMEENVEDAETIIMKWDIHHSKSSNVTSLFLENREEAQDFIKAIQDLRRAMNFFVSENSASTKLVLAQRLMQIAMKRLEKEFYQVLAVNRDHLDADTVSGSVSGLSRTIEDADDVCSENETKVASELNEGEKASVVAMSDLYAIADCMISCGYAKECVKIYKVIRTSMINETIYHLGIEKSKAFWMHRMSWEALEPKIKHWLTVANIAVKRLFFGERILVDHVFPASETIRESCFSEITKEGAMNLFKFPEFVATSHQSPERIYRLLDLYETMSMLWPDIESIFSFESTSAIRAQALTSWLKLGESVLAILSDFESSIQKYSSKTLVDGGGIHPLTKSVMDYLSSLTAYRRTLNEILADYPSAENSTSRDSYVESPTSDEMLLWAISGRLARIILVLLCKIDSKSELYKDAALSYIFLANNLQFVVDKVQTTDLQSLLGDDWIIKHTEKVKLYASHYESIAWNKAYSSLPDSPSEISPEMSEECFRRFNAAFEEAYRKQASWIIPDKKLRYEIKILIARNLVSRYQEFFDTCLLPLREEQNLDALVKYSPDDLGNYLSDLFHGTTISGGSSSSTSSSHSHSGSASHSRSGSHSHSRSGSHSGSGSLLRRILM